MTNEEGSAEDFPDDEAGKPTIQLLSFEELIGDNPLKIDLVFRCNTPSGWTTEQRQRLPDGLRRTKATHLLLNFAEMFAGDEAIEEQFESIFQRILACSWLYQRSHGLNSNDIWPVVVFAYAPDLAFLKELGFAPTKLPGIYQSLSPIAKRIRVMLLSELSSAPHNAIFKCFAHGQQARQQAYQTIIRYQRPYFTPPVRALAAQLATLSELQMEQYDEGLHQALSATLSGPGRIREQEPFADLSSAELLLQVEAYLREQQL